MLKYKQRLVLTKKESESDSIFNDMKNLRIRAYLTEQTQRPRKKQKEALDELSKRWVDFDINDVSNLTNKIEKDYQGCWRLGKIPEDDIP